MTEFELMELLDVGLTQVTLAVALISEIASPPYQTVTSLFYFSQLKFKFNSYSIYDDIFCIYFII